MTRLKTGTQGEHFATQFLWITAQLAVTCLSSINLCLSPINPVNPVTFWW